MAIPVEFLTRFAIPLIVAAFYLEGNGPQQAALYDTILKESDRVLSLANKEGEGPTEFYDYVIVGAGSAGSVLAKRLTEDGSNTVLLLEGGGDPSPISEIPWFLEDLDAAGMMLNYMTVGQENACRSSNGSCWFGRGIALGGSSSVNGLVYNRCNPNDYDSWANFTGDPIWAWNSVVDAFRVVENYQGVHVGEESPNHGSDGELYIGSIEYTPGYEILEEMLTEYGIQIGDLNSGNFPSGFSKLDHNIKNGLRWSTYHGFLEPIIGVRDNLKVYRYAWATKVHLDENKRAVGVTYTRHGQTRNVVANKEVILAAGVIDTPKLLMLSGIGPSEHLTELGIEVVLDLPAVGSHLQEHLGLQIYPFAINQSLGILDPVTPENINEYVTNASGPLLNLRTWQHIANGYFPSASWNDSTWPDLHTYINQLPFATEDGVEQQIVIELELVRTEQTGTLRLASTNPNDDPLIDPHFLEDPMDVQRYVEGIEYLTDLFLNSQTFQRLGIRWSDNFERIPECEQFTFPSSEYWTCFVKEAAGPALHPTSTCRMGPDASVAVVDSKLRVFGTTGLRVIDSSVIPFVPNGNTNLPSIMVGEMGARIILGQI